MRGTPDYLSNAAEGANVGGPCRHILRAMPMRPPRLVKPSPKPAMTLARGGGSTRPVEILLRGGVFPYWRSGAVGCVDKWVFIPSCEGVLQVRYLPTLAHFVRIAFVILLLALVLEPNQALAGST